MISKRINAASLLIGLKRKSYFLIRIFYFMMYVIILMIFAERELSVSLITL